MRVDDWRKVYTKTLDLRIYMTGEKTRLQQRNEVKMIKGAKGGGTVTQHLDDEWLNVHIEDATT